ncbi:GNAT family N-acetyltransferase [Streptomyces sp. NPDC004111]|uniref:GNAT family N-acetyltransferase n=1 Tax=Streptomyces sp. NPDC004111 TaxID=3364690 RepID=UPI0036A00458
MHAWAREEGWNPGLADVQPFFAADPTGFLVARREGDDTPVSCVSVIRYGTDFGFLGLYLARPDVRGQGYGIQVWNAGMARLAGRTVGLDGVVAQQPNYRKSGFVSAWTNTRYEGVPSGTATPPPGVALVDAGTLSFAELAAYDRDFFPAPRETFLGAWLAAPGRHSIAAVEDGRIVGLGTIRGCVAASRIGPFHAAGPDIAAALLTALAATSPGTPVALDVPDINPAAVRLAEQFGLTPGFETSRMYTTPQPPEFDRTGVYAITTLELG